MNLVKIRKQYCFIFLCSISIFYIFHSLITSNQYVDLRILSIVPSFLLITFYINDYKSRIDFFHPYIFIFISVFLGITLRTYWLTDGNLDQQKLNILYNISINDLYKPMIYIIFCVLLFIIGYNIKVKYFNIPNLAYRKINRSRVIIFSLLMLFISILFLIYFLSLVGVGELTLDNFSKKRRLYEDDGARYSFGYHKWIISFSTYIFIFLVVYKFGSNRKDTIINLLIILSCFVMLISSVILSSRNGLVYVMFFVFFVITLRKKLPYKLIILSGISFFILSTFIVSLRSESAKRERETSNYIVDILSSNHTFAGISKIGNIMNHTDQFSDYKYGSTFFNWTYAMIPRTIWKNKPTVEVGLMVRKEIMPTSNKNVGGGIPPSFAGELYWNFGYLGIFFMILYGSFVRFLFDKGRSLVESSRGTLIFLIILFCMTFNLFGSSLSAQIIHMSKHIFTILIFYQVVCKKPIYNKVYYH